MSPDPSTPGTVTILLERAASGDRDASSALFDVLYEELRSRAGAILRDDAGATLQPTALVHEAWLRLVPDRSPSIRDRTHFLRLAAAAMRSVLVDHVRARRAGKRGGGLRRIDLDGVSDVYENRAVDLLALDFALDRLTALDPQLARIVELRFFAGLEVAAIAATLDVSVSTVERGWRTARAWLRCELGEAAS